MADLRNFLECWNGYPETWQPNPGDILTGVIMGYKTTYTKYGPQPVCYIKDDNNGVVSVWLSGTVLRSLFEQQRRQLGEHVGIKYVGKDTTKGYKKYLLVVERGNDFLPGAAEVLPAPEEN